MIPRRTIFQMINFTLMVAPMSLQTSGKRMIIRNGKPMFFKAKEAESYQKTIRTLAAPHRPKKPLAGPLVVDFVFILPRPARLMRKADPAGLIPCPARPDRDNLQKGTQDALSDFWEDDGQIFDGRTSKLYAEKDGQPRILVLILEYGK